MKKTRLAPAASLILLSCALAARTDGPQLDSALVGRDVFGVMPDCVTVHQSGNVAKALEEQLRDNAAREVNGYRIRIYFDNSQQSRNESEGIAAAFAESFPGVPVYRTFSSPYFKVTVGDYRTRSEALAALKGIQAVFPAAFIVKDRFKYPSL